MYIQPGATYEAVVDWGITGATLGLRVIDNAGNTTVARLTTNITEYPAGSGIYARTGNIAPSTAGQYTIVWDDGAGNYATEDLVITYTTPTIPGTPSGRDLCLLTDVTSYAPGYVSDGTTDALLARLITAQSRGIHQETGREFRPINPAVNTRRFLVGRAAADFRKVRIGDLPAAPSTVTLIDLDESTTVRTVTTGNYVLWPRVREEWEPITALTFPWASSGAVVFLPGQVLEITASAWGFPAVPDDIKEACAKLVIVRYVSDVSHAGTLLAEALAEVDIGVLFASARSTIENYARPAIA